MDLYSYFKTICLSYTELKRKTLQAFWWPKFGVNFFPIGQIPNLQFFSQKSFKKDLSQLYKLLSVGKAETNFSLS